MSTPPFDVDNWDGFDPERGRAIKRVRAAGHMTQQELADEVGVSRTAITDWEAGKPIAMANGFRLATVFRRMTQERRASMPADPFAGISDAELLAELIRRTAKREAGTDTTGVPDQDALLNAITAEENQRKVAEPERNDDFHPPKSPIRGHKTS